MQLDRLKQRIDALGRRARPARTDWNAGTAAWRFGVPDVDDALVGDGAGGGLAIGALHEMAGETPADSVAAAGFLLGLIARLPGKGKRGQGQILWCQSRRARAEYGGLYGAGFAPFGLAPDRILSVRTARSRDLPWCLEEGVRAGSVAAIVGEGGALSFTATRRLALACAETATPCLYLDLSGANRASAAATRWRISPAGLPDPDDPLGPGALGWQVSLTRARGGRPGIWHLVWNHETHSFDLAARFRDRAVHRRRAQGGPAARLRQAG